MEKSPERERTIDFIVKFVIHSSKSHGDEEPDERLLEKFFLFCMKYSLCENAAPRFRCVQLLKKLLNCLPPDFGVAPELFEQIRSTLFERSLDAKSTVRSEAAQALARIQDPSDSHCPIVERLTWLASHDSAPDVRKHALASLVITLHTLRYVIDRTRDVNDQVRKTAFAILVERNVFRPLKLGLRMDILKSGLNDPSAQVRNTTRQLLVTWYNLSKRNPIELLRRLDAENAPTCCSTALQVLFACLRRKTGNRIEKLIKEWNENDKKEEKGFQGMNEFQKMVHKFVATSLDEKRLPKESEQPVETVFLWTNLCEYLMNESEKSPEDEAKTVVAAEEEVAEAEAAENDENRPPKEADRENSREIENLFELICPSAVDLIEFMEQKLAALIKVCKEQSAIQEEQMDVVNRIFDMESQVKSATKLLTLLDVTDAFCRRKMEAMTRVWLTSPYVRVLKDNDHSVDLLWHLSDDKMDFLKKLISLVTELMCTAREELDSAALDALREERRQRKQEKQSANSPGRSDLEAEESVLQSARETVSRLAFSMVEIGENAPASSSESEPPKPLTSSQITELRCQMAKLDVQMNELTDAMQSAAEKRAFDKAMECQNALAELRNERSRLCRCIETGLENPPPAEDGAESVCEGTKLDITLVNEREAPRNSYGSHDHDSEEEEDSNVHHLPNYVVLRANHLLNLGLRRFNKPFKVVPSLRTLLHTLTIPSVTHESRRVRKYALWSLGVAMLMDLELALDNLCIVYSALRLDDTEVREVAIHCLSDLFRIYGVSPFVCRRLYLMTGDKDLEDEDDLAPESQAAGLEFPTDLGVTGESDDLRLVVKKRAPLLIKPLLAQLDSADEGCRSKAAICLAKLMLFDKLASPDLFARLFILWFNPVNQDMLNMRRILSVFMSHFARSSLDHQWVIADAIPTVLQILIDAPSSSPLCKVNHASITALLVRLTDNSLLQSRPDIQDKLMQPLETEEAEEPDDTVEADNVCHDELALRLSNSILRSPQSALSKLYVRIMVQLRLSKKRADHLKQLNALAEDVYNCLDHQNRFIFSRYMKRVTGLWKAVRETSPEPSAQETEETVLLEEESILTADSDETPSRTATILGDACTNVHLVPTDRRKSMPKLNYENSTFIRPTIPATSSVAPLKGFSDDSEEEEMPSEPVKRSSAAKRKKKAKNTRISKSSAKKDTSGEDEEEKDLDSTLVEPTPVRSRLRKSRVSFVEPLPVRRSARSSTASNARKS